MAGQDVKGAEIFGIAKKFNNELEDLALHTHSAVVEAMRVAMQHRAIAMEREQKEREMAQREEHLRQNKQQLDLAQAHEDRQHAAELNAVGNKPQLVSQ